MIRPKTIISICLIFTLSTVFTVDGLAVMSVDLGIEYMKIAIVKPGIPMEIVLNKESRRKTPVIVAIKGKDREFGEAAISRSSKIPSQSYMFLRELVGKSLDNPAVQQFLQRFPYYNLKTDPNTNELVFEHDSETNYTIEELLSMIFKKAREYASDFTEQSVDAAVVTVPPYFTQTERRAIKRACELANIKLLQLMNDNTAVALNYGIFRRKDFNASGSTYLFYDMGSQSTVCTLATYNIVKSKENGYLEDVPQLTIKAVAFDRDLGGLEFQIRLRDYLAKKFQEHHPKIDIFKNAKALTKLFREAERAKNVLSANNEYTAQVEGLVDEIDFKHRITREQFEKLCEDLFERVKRPVEEVLNTSGISLAEIQQVLLFGGSTRIPRVQNELVKSLGGIELGKSLNTDEAAAMGGVYQAAALSKGYRVKKFIVKDANQYPINVQFERHADSTTENSEQKLIDRTLFQRNNLYPSRKVMTFNRHTDDFSFDVRYGDLSFLSDTDKRSLGKTDLLRINVSGARKAYEKHQDTSESKGVKAHFQLDDNSLLVLDRVEFVFERKETEAERTNATKDEDESTLSKLGSKISSFFSSSGASSSENDTNNTTNSTEEIGSTNTTETTNDEQTAKPVDEQEGANATENTTTTTTTETTTTTAPPLKTITIREPLEFTVEILDYADPTFEAQANSMKKLMALDTHDRELLALSTAKNNLESFIYDIRDKLEHDSHYKKATTPEEQTKINEKLSETDAWLWDDGINADVKTLKSKLDELKLLTKLLVLRVREVDLRPQKIQELKDTLNSTENFVRTTRMLFSKKEEDEKPFTDADLNSLEKIINDTYKWFDQVKESYAKLLPTDVPKYLSSDFDDKVNLLKRETNYLLGKIQRFIPKPKPTTTTQPPTTTTTAKTPVDSETKIEEEQETTSTTTATPEQTEEETTTTTTQSSEEHPEL
ncbi:unnamed protein product [Rotaria socialis]|uniref:Hypoxia up-regulated protein 1 n=2 Tax=Rotaria socialis TaxID=392032 RepID=A0A821AF13_9BILA|nr:unnamed protein product [Rotaria socialis]CAF3428697.1 unnamed protein product [Rotaria socialis]CAF4576005.1 unnamed protein product [Rotaria socialis]